MNEVNLGLARSWPLSTGTSATPARTLEEEMLSPKSDVLPAPAQPLYGKHEPRSRSLPASLSAFPNSGVPLALSGQVNDLSCDVTLASWRPSRGLVQQLRRIVSPRPSDGMPSFFELFTCRIGSRRAFLLTFAYYVFMVSFCKMVQDTPSLDHCQLFPIMTLSSCISLLFAALVSMMIDGRAALARIVALRRILWFASVAALNVAGIIFVCWALLAGASAGALFVVELLYFPVAATLSLVFLKRPYGTLEFLSMLIMMLAVCTFMLLRVSGVTTADPMKTLTFYNFASVLASCVCIVMASTIAEVFYKNRTFKNGQIVDAEKPETFFIHTAHLGVATAIISGFVWLLQSTGSVSADLWVRQSGKKDAYCTHTWSEWPLQKLAMYVVAFASWSWMSGLMVKSFSTVSRCIIDGLAYYGLILLVNPFAGDNRFLSGSIVAIVLAITYIVAALVFQTGRLIIADLITSMRIHDQHLLARGRRRVDVFLHAGPCRQIKMSLIKYCCMILFILSDAGRQVSQSMALGRLMIVPQTFAFVTYVVGVIVAIVTTMCASRSRSAFLNDLKYACHPRMISRFFPCGFLFGVSTVLTALAYSSGINAGLNTALGYIYTPLSALASAFVLNKYYTWLEWFALAILTCALVLFGLLSSFYGGDDHHPTTFFGVICVIGSAVSSVLASLVAEKLLKQEEKPFHVQKIPLDFGSALSICIVIPLVGMVEPDPKYAFWKARPLSQSCDVDVCWEFGAGKGCGNDSCTCSCGSGFFVGWDNWWIPVALIVNVAQGWLTGLVIKQFSTVGRALAQSFTLLVIYCAFDAMFGTEAPHTLALTFITCIIPLSNMVFVKAATELKKVLPPDVIALQEEVDRSYDADLSSSRSPYQSYHLPPATPSYDCEGSDRGNEIAENPSKNSEC